MLFLIIACLAAASALGVRRWVRHALTAPAVSPAGQTARDVTAQVVALIRGALVDPDTSVGHRYQPPAPLPSALAVERFKGRRGRRYALAVRISETGRVPSLRALVGESPRAVTSGQSRRAARRAVAAAYLNRSR